MIVKMLEGIRAKGKRAIVYDTAGTFVEKFYREGKDILLNPLDERSAVWSPWVDVPHDYHYDQIAESTIPDKHGDPFWPKAARGTLRSEEHTSELQSLMRTSYAVFCLKKNNLQNHTYTTY